MGKRLVLSLRRKDFDVETFRSGGPGGQNQNKRDTGVRIRHRASGAFGTARDGRTQGVNRRNAFRRLVASPTFRLWLARELVGVSHVEARVEREMSPQNLQVEVKRGGRWVAE